MKRRRHPFLAFLTVGAALISAGIASADSLLLTPAEVAAVIRHSPWPPPIKNDPSNRASGSDAAQALGRALFFDSRLSRNGTLSCASCHDPEQGWTDGRRKAAGLSRLDRNTQSVINSRFNRWFGWDGRNDSLWAHTIGPIVDPREMGADPAVVADLISGDPTLSALYEETFGTTVNAAEEEDVLVGAAKAIAAFQETLVSSRTRFDDFRDALARGDVASAGRYPQAAQRGAKIFLGRGKCVVCHVGPLFSNGEFADAAVPYFIEPGRVDSGRHGGIEKLRTSPYSLMSRHNDSADASTAWATRQVKQTHKTFGEFKVPSLRHLTLTAPYMHNGSLATLEDVIHHYSSIDLERLHSDGELILEPLGLNALESADLAAFLRTLSPEPGSRDTPARYR